MSTPSCAAPESKNPYAEMHADPVQPCPVVNVPVAVPFPVTASAPVSTFSAVVTVVPSSVRPESPRFVLVLVQSGMSHRSRAGNRSAGGDDRGIARVGREPSGVRDSFPVRGRVPATERHLLKPHDRRIRVVQAEIAARDPSRGSRDGTG